MAQLEQHQLVAAVHVQGEPVPALLVRRQVLAGPFAVEPGRSPDLVDAIPQANLPLRLEERLAVVPGRLPLPGLAAEPAFAVQHRRLAAGQAQAVAEIAAAGTQAQLTKSAVVRRAAAQMPVVDPRPQRRSLDAGLADPSARIGFRHAMSLGAGHRGMGHPQVAVAPAGLRGTGLQGVAEQRPLHAPRPALLVPQIGRHVPPLDAVVRMRAVIGGEDDGPARSRLGEVRRIAGQPGETLLRRRRAIATGEQQADEYRHAPASVHRRSSAAGRPAHCGQGAITATRRPAG
ncbi:hypothetical protein D3C78_1139780 [compost metagenome]